MLKPSSPHGVLYHESSNSKIRTYGLNPGCHNLDPCLQAVQLPELAPQPHAAPWACPAGLGIQKEDVKVGRGEEGVSGQGRLREAVRTSQGVR